MPRSSATYLTDRFPLSTNLTASFLNSSSKASTSTLFPSLLFFRFTHNYILLVLSVNRVPYREVVSLMANATLNREAFYLVQYVGVEL